MRNRLGYNKILYDIAWKLGIHGKTICKNEMSDVLYSRSEGTHTHFKSTVPTNPVMLNVFYLTREQFCFF